MALVLCMARGSRGGTLAASTGGGGGATAFAYDLDDTYGTSVEPIAHWDASDMNGNGDGNSGWPTDGTGTVSGTSRWIDRTGNYSLVQGAATSQGFYIASAINSKPAVRCTNDENMRLLVKNAAGDTSAAVTADASGFHIYHINNITSNDGGAWGVQGFTWTGTSPTFRIDRIISGSAVDDIKIHNSKTYVCEDAYNKDNWYEMRAYDDGGTNKVLFRYHVDGSEANEAAAQTIDVDLDLESYGATHGSFNPQEDWAETIVFGEALSSDDRGQVESYLDAKYAITDS